MEKFKKQLASENASVCSDPSPKNSLTYHRITPISPSSQIDSSKGRVTTSAIVSHEMDGSKGKSLKSRLSSSSLKTNNSVKWKDTDSSPTHCSASLKDVNASLNRLDRKILHLETLLAKLTEKLSAATSAAESELLNEAKDSLEHEVEHDSVV